MWFFIFNVTLKSYRVTHIVLQFPYPTAILQEKTSLTIILSFADGLLQSGEAGGEEIFSTFRNDEVLERVYRLIIPGIKARHRPGISTLTNNWVKTIKDC